MALAGHCTQQADNAAKGTRVRIFRPLVRTDVERGFVDSARAAAS